MPSPHHEAVSLVIGRIDEADGSGPAKAAARQFVLSEARPAGWEVPSALPVWPPKYKEHALPPEEFSRLWERARGRVPQQDVRSFLPPADVDLAKLRLDVLADVPPPAVRRRANMRNQVEILEHRFRGGPKTCFLNGLVISYLRRNTPHTKSAWILFHRLWNEEFPLLLALLPTRWLISTLQTFLDHGVTEEQRMVGAAGFFYANLIKAYEAERALDGISPEETYRYTEPKARQGFPGLDRFRLGGSDLIVNVNSLLLEIAMREPAAGRVAMEFLARLRNAHTIMSRMDASRRKHNTTIEGFESSWSFFEP